VLSRLNRSGMERMLECSYELWAAAGVEPIIVGMADGEHPYADVLARRGYRVLELPAVRSVRGLRAFRRVLHATRPDLVHIHQESCLDAVALLSVTTSGVKGVVQTVHTSFSFTGNLRLRRKVRTAFSRRLGVAWVACGWQVAETELSFYGNRALVVENWVDVDSIVAGATPEAGRRVREELGVDPEARVLGLVGNCGDPKNHELIPLALGQVSKPVHLLHIGDASGMTAAERESWPRLPRRHTVHDLGARDDIPQLLAACDLVLVPSRYEGLPLVPIEALCAGVPIVAADVLALKWLASFPAVALAPLDTVSWGVAIDAALIRDWTAEAKASAAAGCSRFNPDRGVSEYIAIYERVVGHNIAGHSLTDAGPGDMGVARSG
jgi:glycosyltransferase involved in cell wall biosynthesis